MKQRLELLALSLGLAMWLGIPSSSSLPAKLLALNLIQNGSFEEGIPIGLWTHVFANTPQAFAYLPYWEVIGNSVDYCSQELWPASHGTRSLELDGEEAGGIAQTFATVAGREYSVSFDLAGHGLKPKGTRQLMRVRAAKQEAKFAGISSGDRQNMKYQRKSWKFTANSNATRLEFIALTNDSYGAVIDNITVVPVSLPLPPK